MITILSDVGGLYKIISFFILIPLGVSLYTHDWIGGSAFLLILLYFGVLGHILDKLPQYREYTKLSSALASIALAWLTSGIVFGIPYYICTEMTVSQSVFEGMAGWTRTSFSFLQLTEQIDLSSSLFFWRAYTQWIGGLAMLSVFISLMKGVQYSLFHQSMHERHKEHIITSLQSVIRKIIPYYLIFSVIAWCMILANHVPLLDSIYLMLSSVSTGGFIPYPDNIMYYNNASLEITLICIMIAAALPLPLFFTLFFQRDIAAFVREKQIFLLFFFILSCTLIIACGMIPGFTTELLNGDPFHFWSLIRYSLFMSVSAATTTGFWNTNFEGWSDVNLIFIMLLMFIGGSAMSMTGGIKLRRVLLWFAGVNWWVRQIFAPSHAVVPLFFEGQKIGSNEANLEISKSTIVIVSSTLLIGVFTFLFMHMHPDADVLPIIFDVTSAFATSGLSLSHVTPDMPIISIWCIIILMWAGSLEVFPAIILFVVLFRRKNG
ncbi:MAG: hypothetical protein LBV40_03590 [Methanomicrobiales archaeon]|nr:hypothetical protein [Methanomicrobiales archaeon]